MKKFLFILLLLFSASASAKIDIYYTNGIWAFRELSTDGCYNDKAAADCGRKALEGKLKSEGILNDPTIDVNDKGKKVTLQYNISRGRLNDILETYYQLRESGQLGPLEFFAFAAAMSAINPVLGAAVLAAAVAPMQETKEFEQKNVDKMVDAYTRYSIDEGDQIMLVSHSQGNLFANRVFDELNETGYDYKNFANVQVASPADRVHAPIGKHITICGDMVVGPIPHSMRCNAEADGSGLMHGFDEVYLHYDDPRN